VKAAFGMHVWPALPSGMIASRPGTLLAGAIQFEVSIKGRGGHAAMPHLTVDPVLATTAVVGAVQALVSRETSPFDSAVISVTRLAGGGAYNVVPDEGACVGGGCSGTGSVAFVGAAAGWRGLLCAALGCDLLMRLWCSWFWRHHAVHQRPRHAATAAPL
jgi:hypothetical protein